MSEALATFTTDQVESLNAFQHSGQFHPFTCGNAACRAVLIATVAGWRCPKCVYTQNWAHSFMADWSWQRMFDDA